MFNSISFFSKNHSNVDDRRINHIKNTLILMYRDKWKLKGISNVNDGVNQLSKLIATDSFKKEELVGIFQAKIKY